MNIIILFGFLIYSSQYVVESTMQSDACERPCNKNTKPMVCKYNWNVEWYSVLSKACLNCPLNLTACENLNCIPGNGLQRPIITINRQLPGPIINVCQGDTIRVRVTNKLRLFEGTSIHWHGITQKGKEPTPFYDGVSFVTQCPINANTFFDYEFNAYNPGTHLWHAHSGVQRADGAFGPLIVRQYDIKNSVLNLYDFDLSEHIISVNDWINNTAITKFVNHIHADGNNKPDSLLINGRGSYFKFTTQNGSSFQTPRAQFKVKQGFRYRIRVINGGFLYCPIQISIDGHNLTIIATDGNLVEPVTIQNFVIYAGERYDFVLNANQNLGNYLIRAKGLADCGVNKVFETAILRYTDENGQIQNINNQMFSNLSYSNLIPPGLQFNPWNTQINTTNMKNFVIVDQLRSILDPETNKFLNEINKKNVKTFYLGMEFNKIDNAEVYNQQYYPLNLTLSLGRTPFYTPQINGISLTLPSSPILYNWNNVPKNMICNYFNKNQSCSPNDQYCSCIYTLEFDLGDIVEFVIVDQGFTYQSNHPMHLHGSSYAVLAVNKLNTSIRLQDIIDMDKNGLLRRNLNRPPIKDTVTVPVGGYTIIRFVADNPGSWLFHCHIDFHSEIGMGLIVKVGSNKHLPPMPKNWPKCGNYALP